MRTIQIPPATVCILPDSKALARASADAIVQAAQGAISKHDRFSIALSGGSTPKVIFEVIARDQSAGKCPVEWGKVHVFFGDERCVPADHEDSNFRMASEALLSKIPIPPSQVYRIRTELGEIAAAERCIADVRIACQPASGAVPCLDLVMLGMGNDGHTASLFPETSALEEQNAWVVANWVPKLSANRITFTYPLINAAKEVLFIAGGAEKAKMLRDVLRGDPTGQSYPSQRVKPIDGELTWLVDEAAAALL
jgi:6-phosphogluconolactonase